MQIESRFRPVLAAISGSLWVRGTTVYGHAVVNGGVDPLYPLRNVDPFVAHLQKGGVTIDYRQQLDGAHNTSWWPVLKDAFEAFVREHPRDPYPARITWESTGVETGKRAHWLIIDRIAPSGREQFRKKNV